jgi:hypothetical protein
MMNLKARPNHRLYLETLARMSPSERLRKAFELSDFSKRLFVQGLKTRFPDLPAKEFNELLLKRLALCHNRNY